MKNKKNHIPHFKNESEEAKFWDSHSIEEFSDELKEIKNVSFPKPRKRLISMRIEESQINILKEIAQTKGIGYLVMLRMWITERLNKEKRTLQT